VAEYTMTVLPSGRRIPCPARHSVLDACLAGGLRMPYNCRSGECGECMATLHAGEVEQSPGADPAVYCAADRARGRILTCMSFARSDLELTVVERATAAGPRVARIGATVEEQCWHGPELVELHLRTPRPVGYRAGQYFEFVIPGISPNRHFSVANRPGATRLSFHLRLHPEGMVSEHVRSRLSVGDRVELVGPHGRFGLTENAWRPAICVAGGTGMAPIRAMLEQAFHQGDKRPVRYFYGARTRQELYCLEDMAALAADNPRFSFLPVLSEEPEHSDWRGARGLVTEVLERELGDAFGAEGYLCGPPAMVDRAIEVLTAAGLAEEDIRYDKFTPMT